MTSGDFANGPTDTGAGVSGAARRLEIWEAELGTPGSWMRILLVGTAAGGAIGVIGFVSGDLLICLFNWLGLVVVGTVLAALMMPALIRRMRRASAPLPVAVAAALAAAALPISAFAALFSAWVWPAEVGRMSALDWYMKTLLVGAAIAMLWVVTESRRRRSSREFPRTQVRCEADSAFCLQMEDHDVRVHDGSGSRLELMSMTQAIARYGTCEGMRVHRSWWVAESAISGVERDGRNLRLKLENGLAVPIARHRIAHLRARLHDLF